MPVTAGLYVPCLGPSALPKLACAYISCSLLNPTAKDSPLMPCALEATSLVWTSSLPSTTQKLAKGCRRKGLMQHCALTLGPCRVLAQRSENRFSSGEDSKKDTGCVYDCSGAGSCTSRWSSSHLRAGDTWSLAEML